MLEGSRGFSQPPKIGRGEAHADAKSVRRELESIFFRIKLNGFFSFCVFVLLKCKMIFVCTNLTSISMCLGYKVFLYIMIFLW